MTKTNTDESADFADFADCIYEKIDPPNWYVGGKPWEPMKK